HFRFLSSIRGRPDPAWGARSGLFWVPRSVRGDGGAVAVADGVGGAGGVVVVRVRRIGGVVRVRVGVVGTVGQGGDVLAGLLLGEVGEHEGGDRVDALLVRLVDDRLDDVHEDGVAQVLGPRLATLGGLGHLLVGGADGLLVLVGGLEV